MPHYRHLGFRFGADSFRKGLAEAQRMADEFTERVMWRVPSVMHMRVWHICGYDPQRLLPAPTFEREFIQSMAEWAAEQIRLPYTEFADGLFKVYDYQAKHIEMFWKGGSVDPLRWGEATRSPLEDIERFREYVMTETGYDHRVIWVNPEELPPVDPKRRLHIIHDIQPKKPAKKQNGRSAAYLDHDPTKNKRRHRR